MDKVAVAVVSPSATLSYVSWEEVFVSNDIGMREVHYLLKRKDGSSDLAVVGIEKSLRHMAYHYAIPNPSVLGSKGTSSAVKLKSRREVIDWLNSIVTDAHHESSHSAGGSLHGSDAVKSDIEDFKDFQFQSLGHYTKDFLWLGSSWTCRKKRRHFQSFRRNGAKISVHDFVFVLAEEDKQLVAYLEDMYEDSRGNKMVVVRWFHKIDEVGIVLPHNYNDREIFFSLCLQDLSIECIDGLATVLSPQHFEKFMRESVHPQLKPFVCYNQFENDDVKPFDITQVKGYWKQEVLRYMYGSSSKLHVNSQSSDAGIKVDKDAIDVTGTVPRKRLRRLRDANVNKNGANKKESAADTAQYVSSGLAECKNGTQVGSLKGGLSVKEATKENPPLYLTVGSEVEVLSQDSGIRGCWFRAVIIKKHKDKVKVRYQDILDAADETKKLEEWLEAFKVAITDQLGFRMCGRTTIRPPPQFNKGRVSCVVAVGTAVDVWWHDGWWEGIIVNKETQDKIRIFFPGKKKTSTFGLSELRYSQEWLGNSWRRIKERIDIASSISFGLETEQVPVKFGDSESTQVAAVSETRPPMEEEAGGPDSHLYPSSDNVKEESVVPDLSKDDLLSHLKWNSFRKRKRSSRSSVKKPKLKANNSTKTAEAAGLRDYGRYLIPDSVRVDHENCKYMGDSLFKSPAVPPLTSMVMSR